MDAQDLNIDIWCAKVLAKAMNFKNEKQADVKLNEMVQRLINTFQPEAIYLFGSRAVGDCQQDSDYDILIVMPTLDKPVREYVQQAYETLWGIGVSKDIIFTSRERFEGLKTVTNSVEEAAYSDGKILYAA